MDKKSTLERVRTVICDILGIKPDQLNDDADIAKDLSADTLDIVEICMELETEFDIAISDREFYTESGDRLKYPTPAAIATYLDSRLK